MLSISRYPTKETSALPRTLSIFVTAFSLFALGGCNSAVSDISVDAYKSRPQSQALMLMSQYGAGPKPAAYYAQATQTPVTSNLSFDAIGQKASIIQGRAGLAPGAKEPILAYIFFDPLCPHCAKLYANTLKSDGITIVNNIAWVPIGFLQEFSTLQGATLLSAPDASVAMARHEALVLAGRGKEYSLNVGLAKKDAIDKVVANTELWRAAGAALVPFIVTKDPSGKTLARYGELEGFEMAEFLSKPSSL